VVASHPPNIHSSGDIMPYAKSSSLKKNKNLDEHVTVAVTDNILQAQTIEVGTTSKGQSKEEPIRPTIAADPSPRHLQTSSKSLERAKVCNVEGVIDELSYAVIAKIRRGIIEIQRREQQQQSKSKPRILCMVYTYEGAHASNLQAIVDTWAAQCDGFFAASNVTDLGLGAVDIKSMYFGPEAYDNMWNKIEAMWKYAYKHYLNDYDYFHICGDDAYVISDNLRAYLMGEQVNNLLNGHLDDFSVMNGRARRWKKQRPRPLLLGYPLHFNQGKSVFTYAAGGSGCKSIARQSIFFCRLIADKFTPNTFLI